MDINRVNRFFTLSIALWLICYAVYKCIFTGFSGNETVYLISPLRLASPDLFLNDWTWNNGPKTFGYLFSLVTSPLFFFTSDTLIVAKITRALLWILAFSSIIYCFRAFRFSYLSIFSSLTAFLLLGQGLIAGEWLFGGGEQKVIAYSFVFVAIGLIAKEKYVASGFCSGLAFCFHILVGGWAAVSLGIILLIRFKKDKSQLLKFATLSIPIASLMILSLLLNGIIGESEISSKVSAHISELLVKFRNPHHLDPFHFLHYKKLLVCFAFLGSALFFHFRATRAKQEVKLLTSILLVNAGVFLVAIIARFFELYSFLNLYPFRLADLLFPLILCLLYIDYFISKSELLLEQYSSFKWSYILILVVFIATVYFKLAYDVNKSHGPKRNKASGFSGMAHWIKENTDKSTIIAANPCIGSFWIKTERAMVVNFKSAPVGSDFLEWYERVKQLNNKQQFTEVGALFCEELRNNFNHLDHTALLSIHKKYDAELYLVNTERLDLKQFQMHNSREYYLYDISSIDIKVKSTMDEHL